MQSNIRAVWTKEAQRMCAADKVANRMKIQFIVTYGYFIGF
jgi:hypothetical protein